MRVETAACLWVMLAATTAGAEPVSGPRNVGVTFDGEAEVVDPLAADVWHTVVASYRYPGGVGLLTNTYLVLARGGDMLSGFYVGYNLPRNELAIVKHGYWNATEADGYPGEAGHILENDQGYLDCENTTVRVTDDEVVVSYRLRFKPGVMKGAHNVYQYIEDRDIRYEGFTIMGGVTIEGDGAVHRTDMPAGWSNALEPKVAKSAPLTLASEGQPLYALVVPAEAQRVELKAASDLQRVLKLICGAELPICPEGTGEVPAARRLSLGRTALLEASACRWKTGDLGPEGYALEVQGEDVFIYGSAGRGLMNGVYALAEEDLGCRWYSLTAVDTPRAETLTVRLAPRWSAPALEMRDPYILKMHEANWSLHNRTNTPHARIPQSWGGSLRYHHMGHTYARYFPTEQYFAQHPEYYSLVNGKRQPSQLCHTNEDVIRLSIEKTCEIFRDHPEVTITAIGPNDGRGFCDCEDCRRLDDENGGRSGSYFYFLNRIIEGVRQEFPDRYIISLAYLDYAPPPTHMEVNPGIIVQLCTDSHAWKYQFCPQWESPEFQGILKAWEARRAKVYVWDYTTDYVHYLVPMANWATVALNTRFMVEHGAAGIMYESELNDCDEMRAWVWAKQLWDPSLDTRALLRDFVFGYYKEAAEPLWEQQMAMWDFWERWHAVPHTPGVADDNPLLNNLQCSYAPDGPMFGAEFMGQMRARIERAEALARSDEIRARVRRAKLSLLYLELAQGLGYICEFGDWVPGRDLDKPRADRERYQTLLDEFVAGGKEAGLGQLGIPITLDRIAGRWQRAIGEESAAAPKVLLPAEWIFAADREDRGVAEGWAGQARFCEAAARLNAGTAGSQPGEGLARLHLNRGVGWEQQGFAGMDRYGWYFQRLALPQRLQGKAHVYLFLPGVNEEAWVYLNGQQVGERSYASTGKGNAELVGSPLIVDLGPQWHSEGVNEVAVRVSHQSGLGGIYAPGMLVASDEALEAGALDGLRY